MHVILSLALLLVAVLLISSWIASRPRGHLLASLANVAEGFYPGRKTYKTDAAVGTRYLLGKIGSDLSHVAVCGAADKPLGIISDEAAAAEDLVNVDLLGTTTETKIGVASEAIAVGADVYTAADGKVQDEPAAAGTYWRIGKALSAAGADDDQIEFDPHAPVRVVVLAELTAPDTADGSDAGTTQTLANALKADLAALEAALATPAEIKLLNS